MTRVFIAAVLALAAGLAAAPAAAQPFAISGRVVGVIDGDTVDVLDAANGSHRIRLASIDAPERSQPFGQRSKEGLSGLVFGQAVEAHCRKMERRPEGQRNRALCKVFLAGRDVNLTQLQAGLAWHYKAYANEQPLQERRAYDQAESEARAAGRGLWRDSQAIPPWDWRHQARGGAQP